LIDFNKSFNIKGHEKSSSGSQADTCGQTDKQKEGHNEDNKRFLEIYVKAPEKKRIIQ
jgi:hypothetical protein